jgi:SAM-dependent methyltransferase
MRRLFGEISYNLELLREFGRGSTGASDSAVRVRARQLGAVVRRLSARPAAVIERGPFSRALHDENDVVDALARVRRLALPPHPDRPKNWDAFRAFSFILGRAGRGAAVLDMGSSAYCRILAWLHLYGLRDLHGCDLVFERSFSCGSVEFTRQNIEATNYPARRFDVVTCLSVLEHGVQLDRFFAEVSRVLRPGGYLLLSVDYWDEGLPTGGLVDAEYGCDVRVFTRADISEALRLAARCGFHPVEPVDDSCVKKAVRWERFGLEFTFLFVALRLGQAQ